METMFLVAGLAIAAVVGIAAAFYLSIRSGGDRRLRSIRLGRAGADRHPGRRSGGPDRPGDARQARRRAAGIGQAANPPFHDYSGEAGTGPNPVLDFADPMPAGGRRSGTGTPAGDPATPAPRLAGAELDESGLDESRSGSRFAARLSREANAAGGAARTRRRVGFRKGADVDEELWPAESFGGVSDEQFWDDLASDKPRTTTARTAQQDPGTRNRPLNAMSPPAAVPPAAGPRTTTQLIQSVKPQVPGATQPVRTVAATGPLMTPPDKPSNADKPRNGSQQPNEATQPAETRGRRRAGRSDEEDPLTSAAFSLRSSGPVDGRSARRSRDMPREPYDATDASATQTMSTPPYGENYGYGSGSSPVQQGDPRRPNGARSHARHGGTGDATRPAQQASPPDGRQGIGSPPAGGYQGGTHQGGGYPGGTYQGGGYSGGGYPGGTYQGGGYPGGGNPAAGHQGRGYPGDGHQTSGYPGGPYQGNANAHRDNAYRGNGNRAAHDPRDEQRRLTRLG
jgi:hypothetical protein